MPNHEKSPAGNEAFKNNKRRINHTVRHHRSKLDFDRINAAALSVLPSLLYRWLPDGKMQKNFLLNQINCVNMLNRVKRNNIGE